MEGHGAPISRFFFFQITPVNTHLFVRPFVRVTPFITIFRGPCCLHISDGKKTITKTCSFFVGFFPPSFKNNIGLNESFSQA